MKLQRLAAFGSIALVGIAIVAGLYVAGSPAEQRLLRLDDRRVTDLQRLSRAATRYYSQTDRLPASLDGLADGRRLSSVPRDPESGEPYEYNVHGDGRFELCAEFSRESRQAAERDFWRHGRGRDCFEFDLADLGSD